MSEYKSYLYCSSNENGEEEVELEYPKNLFQLAFNKPNTVETWVGRRDKWRNKVTGKAASIRKVSEILDIVISVKISNAESMLKDRWS